MAQMHDNIWLFGAGGGSQTPMNDSFGMTLLDFSEILMPQIIEKQQYSANFQCTNAVMCDSIGNLMFYTNGESVYSHSHKVMQNGNDIASGNNNGGSGLRMPQGAIALPYPDHDNQYVLITLEAYPTYPFGWNLFYHVIDMNADNGLGRVIEKRVLIVQDSMTWGHVTATKHANGRDWWFVVQKRYSNKYYVGLVKPESLYIELQTIGEALINGFGQAVFSSDGTKYIHTNDNNLLTPNQITIMDFDRCTGKLSNFQTKFLPNLNTFGVGCAVSPDSKYLYVLNTTEVFQYDLKAQDIFSTESLVAQWDGTYYYFWPVNFFLAQNAPDGRIYVNSNNGSSSMHYINFPKRQGEQCQFRQNGIRTPTIILYEMPNLPNYRLGPLDGSACDTLGLDNHPLARWRWEQEDTLQPLTITFTDLSDYEPANWYWTFGDGQSSTAQYPVHAYGAKGVYTVCLVVSNANSADTLCRVLELGVSGTGAAERPGGISIIPNPANEYITIQSNQPQTGEMIIELTTATGQVAKRVTNSVSEGSSANVDIRTLPAGIYYCRVLVNGQAVHTGKVIITH
jgi:hypothetical protein